ncbi:corepressor interacting with RBPJ 1-like [Macrobrachium rosenbergii]|uniref:corepressor interacting with RBPJ 1-like n=1 Tax=Macrobrachium rosenbergii TaxID=79674 RepID=UPI0034D6BDE7
MTEKTPPTTVQQKKSPLRRVRQEKTPPTRVRQEKTPPTRMSQKKSPPTRVRKDKTPPTRSETREDSSNKSEKRQDSSNNSTTREVSSNKRETREDSSNKIEKTVQQEKSPPTRVRQEKPPPTREKQEKTPLTRAPRQKKTPKRKSYRPNDGQFLILTGRQEKVPPTRETFTKRRNSLYKRKLQNKNLSRTTEHVGEHHEISTRETSVTRENSFTPVQRTDRLPLATTTGARGTCAPITVTQRYVNPTGETERDGDRLSMPLPKWPCPTVRKPMPSDDTVQEDIAGGCSVHTGRERVGGGTLPPYPNARGAMMGSPSLNNAPPPLPVLLQHAPLPSTTNTIPKLLRPPPSRDLLASFP